MPEASPDTNLAESLSQWTSAFGWWDRAAYVCGDDVYTHGEVHRGAARMAGLLDAHGARPGHRVVIALPGSIEFVLAFLGVLRIGAIALLADPEAPALPPADFAVCAPGRHRNTITTTEVAAEMPRAKAMDPHPVLADTPAYVHYSSMFAHGDPEASYLAMKPLGLRENDVLFSVPRTDDPAGLRNTVFLPLFCGASAVLDPGHRSVSDVADGVRRHRASVLFSTSAFFTRMASERPPEAFGRLRIAVAQGTAPPPCVEEWLGCPVVTPRS